MRDSRHYARLRERLTAEALADLLPGGHAYRIDRFELPNLAAVNFVVHGWLGDGVASCLRLDSQAKGLAEYLRARHVDVPTDLLDIM